MRTSAGGQTHRWLRWCGPLAPATWAAPHATPQLKHCTHATQGRLTVAATTSTTSAPSPSCWIPSSWTTPLAQISTSTLTKHIQGPTTETTHRRHRRRPCYTRVKGHRTTLPRSATSHGRAVHQVRRWGLISTGDRLLTQTSLKHSPHERTDSHNFYTII